MWALWLAACGSAPQAEPAPVVVDPAWDPAACVEPLPGLDWQPVGEGRGGLKHAVAEVPDLDGDGRAERFTVLQDAGDGEAAIRLLLEPTASDPIAMETSVSYRRMVQRIPVPAVLQGPERAAWRAPFEQELLRRRCPEPSPGHRWLVDPASRSRWVAGEPVLPFLHGVYDSESEAWSLYLGHTHTMDPPPVGRWPVEDEVRGDLHLLRTQHGVLVRDAALGAYRWLYVSEVSGRKLRLPTVALSGFDGDAVVVEVHGEPGRARTFRRVDLRTGAVEVRDAP